MDEEDAERLAYAPAYVAGVLALGRDNAWQQKKPKPENACAKRAAESYALGVSKKKGVIILYEGTFCSLPKECAKIGVVSIKRRIFRNVRVYIFH